MHEFDYNRKIQGRSAREKRCLAKLGRDCFISKIFFPFRVFWKGRKSGATYYMNVEAETTNALISTKNGVALGGTATVTLSLAYSCRQIDGHELNGRVLMCTRSGTH